MSDESSGCQQFSGPFSEGIWASWGMEALRAFGHLLALLVCQLTLECTT
jgi:hypothetical protein